MDPEFIAKLQAAFKEEANEHLQSISSSLLAIEKDPESSQIQIESLLRTFHSLKGSSRAVNLNRVEKTCQIIESLLIKYKSETVPNSAILLLNSAVGKFQRIVEDLGKKEVDESVLDPLVESLSNIESGVAAESSVFQLGTSGDETITQASEGKKARSEDEQTLVLKQYVPVNLKTADSIRLPVDQLENFVKLSEELVYAKLSSEQRTTELSEIQSNLNQWSRRWQRLRPELENLVQSSTVLESGSRATELREFVDMHDSFVAKMHETLNSIEKSVVADKRTIHSLVDSLLDRGRELTMVPFEVLNNLLERIVWDIAKQQDKIVNLEVVGSDVQIDRNILDELKDPIVHLIRNCIDHGVETVEERIQADKDEAANIVIELEPIGSGKVKIEVRDNGRGINLAHVKTSALEKRLVREDQLESMTEEQIFGLLFRSSFSTKEEVSTISGRGLGLTIVKENVEKLNGTVTISSIPNKETRFTIIVPVRRATMVGIIAKVGNQTVVIPTIAINSAVRLIDQDVRILQGRWTLNYNERLLPIVRLADILQVESKQDLEESVALIVGTSEYPIALTVEDVFGEQEVAVKNLPPPLTKVRNIAGATQLKTGDLAVVLNMNDVLTSPYLVGALTGKAPPVASSSKRKQTTETPVRKSILVVEDSITSRVLLKNILESAGYKVNVASDGIDGWEKFRQDNYDLVVTDIEMPRMNGFELTQKIRQQSETPSVPIVVITSLASLDDRKKGVEVGASAYFVKSNFEKSNLLDMVKRLI